METILFNPEILPGVKDSGFCTDLEENPVFILKQEQKLYILTIQYAEELAQNGIALPEIIKSGHWRCNILLKRNSTPFIVSLVTVLETNKNFILSCSLNNNTNTHSIADRRNTGCNYTEKSVERLLQDGQGRLFFISYFRSGKELMTTFDASQIEIDDKGKITLNSVAKQWQLNGEWFRPFIDNGYCYWQPVDPDTTFKKLLRVSFQDKKADVISVQKSVPNVPKFLGTVSNPLVVGDCIFFYAGAEENDNGTLLILDMKKLCWQILFLKTNNHTIARKISFLNPLDKNLIYVHGNCNSTVCHDEAHIYIIDLRKTELPQLCLLHVFRFLDVAALAACELTCRKWNNLIDVSLNRLPKRELYRVYMNFSDRKVSLYWLTNTSPTYNKLKVVDLEDVDLLQRQMKHFTIEQLQLYGSDMITYLSALRMTEQKVATLDIVKLIVNDVDEAKQSLLSFIDNIESSIEELIFRSNCDFGSALTDDFFAKPWMKNLKKLDLSCITNVSPDILTRLDHKKITNLDISENMTSFPCHLLAELLSTTANGGCIRYLCVRNNSDELQQAVRERNLSGVIENIYNTWTNLMVYRGTCLLANVSVYQS